MRRLLLCAICLIAADCLADTSLIQIDKSPHAKMRNVGLDEVKITGVAWQDAWIYKWIEAACYVDASTKDPAVMKRVEFLVPIIAKAQEDDGYIATQVTAGKFHRRWIRPDNHELYNMGHLLSAAAVHYRFSGKADLVDVANRAATFCLKQFKEHPDVMWEYPLNPSIIMGAVELYRATGNRDALDLAGHPRSEHIRNQVAVKRGPVKRQFPSRWN